MEARDLIILQTGTAPLRPMAVSADTYVLALPGAVPPDLVLAEMFAIAPPLVVDEIEAERIHDVYMDSVSLILPVPISADHFVPQALDEASSASMTAFYEWQRVLCLRRMAIHLN